MHAFPHGIPALADMELTAVTAIAKGLSSDKKYCLETASGDRMLLRMAGISDASRKKAEYTMTAHAFAHGIPVPQSLGCGLCEDGKSFYSLFRWIDGIDADKALPGLSDKAQYEWGQQSGLVLRQIHSVPLLPEPAKQGDCLAQKVKKWIGLYYAKPSVHCATGEMVVRYLHEEQHALHARPHTFIHGDFNTENIILRPDGAISVIDFNSYNTASGDPWEELDNMAWMPSVYPRFHAGQIDAYFDGNPPETFWHALRYQLALTALIALTDSYGVNGVENGLEITERILNWTDCFRSLKPTWY